MSEIEGGTQKRRESAADNNAESELGLQQVGEERGTKEAIVVQFR